MSNLRVPCLVPGNPRQVVFGLEIFETYVPNKRAESLDGINFIALGANEAQSQRFIRFFWIAFLAVCNFIVAGVFERIKAYIPQRHCPSTKWFRINAQRRRRV